MSEPKPTPPLQRFTTEVILTVTDSKAADPETAAFVTVATFNANVHVIDVEYEGAAA